MFAHVFGEFRCIGTIFVAVRASMLGGAAVICHLMSEDSIDGRILTMTIGALSALGRISRRHDRDEMTNAKNDNGNHEA